MIFNEGIHKKSKRGIFTECYATMNKLKYYGTKIQRKFAYRRSCIKINAYIKHLRTFVEIRVLGSIILKQYNLEN